MSSAARRLTCRDLFRLPEDGFGHQILRGARIMTPPPGTPHQSVALEIAVLLREASPPRGVILMEAGVRLSPEDFLEPDVFYLSAARRDRLRKPYVQGAPDLVVEVLSPSLRRFDVGPKLDTYRRFGVREYWIVDPDARTFTVHDFERGRIRTPKRTFRSVVLPGLKVDVASVFSILDR